MADPVILELIARNLIGNAMRYTRRGRVTIAARRVNSDRVRLLVIDNGPGIENPKLRRLKGAFDRLGDRQDVPGFGIGLYVSEQYARSIGTTIGVVSVVGRGSMFFVDLPIAPVLSGGSKNFFSGEPATPPRSPLGEKVILVVDDEPDVATAIGSLLVRWGYRAEVVTTTEDARSWLLKNKPDFIITDWDICCDGSSVCLIDAAVALYGETPACIVTGDLSHSTRPSPPFPVLVKPVPPAKLRAVLQAAFRTSQGLVIQ